MQEKTFKFQEADTTLLAAVDDAIERAVETAGPELQALGIGRTPHDYFADAALRHLFLRLCGADPQTNTGGDPEAAWEILYMGRSVARYWERERGVPAVIRRKKDRPEDIEKDASERRLLTLAARDFTVKTAIRVLIDHARESNPQIDERFEALIDARHERLENVSETDREFTENARRYMRLLTGLPK